MTGDRLSDRLKITEEIFDEYEKKDPAYREFIRGRVQGLIDDLRNAEESGDFYGECIAVNELARYFPECEPRARELGDRAFEMEKKEIESHPLGRLLLGEHCFTSLCCQRMKEAHERRHLCIMFDCVSLSPQLYLIDEVPDENGEGNCEEYTTDECPFCGKPLEFESED